MRINYTDTVVMLFNTSYDRYGQPTLGEEHEVKVKWQRKQDVVTLMAPFPVPSGRIFWYGDLKSYKEALKSATRKGINLWEVKFPDYQRDVKGRIAYYTATLEINRSTNTGSVL